MPYIKKAVVLYNTQTVLSGVPLELIVQGLTNMLMLYSLSEQTAYLLLYVAK